MPAQSTSVNPFTEKGAAMQKENRKIHFMNVMTEYFDINGLNIPRYIEKLSMLNMIITIPKGVV